MTPFMTPFMSIPAFMIEIIGMLAAILGTICWLPQALKTILTKDTSGLSLWTNSLLFMAVILWLTYGLAIGSWPLILGNIVNTMLVGTIGMLKIRHG